MQLHCFILLVAHLNLPTRCQYGTKQTCHSVLSDVCLDAVQQAMFGCG